MRISKKATFSGRSKYFVCGQKSGGSESPTCVTSMLCSPGQACVRGTEVFLRREREPGVEEAKSLSEILSALAAA